MSPPCCARLFVRHGDFSQSLVHVACSSQVYSIHATNRGEWRRRHSVQGHKAGKLAVLDARCFWSWCLLKRSWIRVDAPESGPALETQLSCRRNERV